MPKDSMNRYEAEPVPCKLLLILQQECLLSQYRSERCDGYKKLISQCRHLAESKKLTGEDNSAVHVPTSLILKSLKHCLEENSYSGSVKDVQACWEAVHKYTEA